MQNRHQVRDSECLHGGPLLSDSMMEFAYDTLSLIEKKAWKISGKKKRCLTVGDDYPDTSDISLKGLGGARAYVACMIHYIKQCEEELRRVGSLPSLEEQLSDPPLQ